MSTTFLQYYPSGDSTYVPQRRLSETENNKRRMSRQYELLDERRKSEALCEKAVAINGVQSLRQGKLPTNIQLLKILNRLLQSRTIENNKKFISLDGQILLNDLKEFIMVLQDALIDKNRDELFQSMIYHVKRSEETYHDSEQIKKEIKTGAGSVLKLAKLFLFNTQFRDLLGKTLTIAQRTFQECQKTDPNVSIDPKLSGYLTKNNNDSIPMHSTTTFPTDSTQVHDGHIDPLTFKSSKNFEKQRQVISDNINSAEIINELKQVIIIFQRTPEFKDALFTLISLLSVWGQRIKTGTGGMDRRPSSAVAIPEQSEYYKNIAAFEAKTIIEDWAQRKSIDPILQEFQNLSNILKLDQAVQKIFETITVYIKKLMNEPDYLASEQSTEHGKRLISKIQSSVVDEYKPHVRSLIQKSTDIIQAISNDPTSKKISSKLKDIHNHLWFDKNGNVSFKPQLINDMRITLLPALIEQIKYVPLPEITYSNKQYEIAIENMALEGDTLMPEIFEIKVDDFLRFSPNVATDYVNTQSFNIYMSGIQTTMNDVIFYYKRKTGFPKISDSGVVSISTVGEGLCISMRITSSSLYQYHTFKVEQCHCYIDKLDIKVQSCKHNLMYKIFNPVLTGNIKRQLCKSIENQVTSMFETSDEKLTKYLRVKQNENNHSNAATPGKPGVFSFMINYLYQKITSVI